MQKFWFFGFTCLGFWKLIVQVFSVCFEFTCGWGKVEDARLQPIRSDNSTSASWPKSNWPKSKLAKVEQTLFVVDGVC